MDQIKKVLTSDVRKSINTGKMNSFQVQTVLLCTFINMLDGFDVLVMSFAASSVAAEWGLSPVDLGFLLSSGLIGMALGSVSLGSMADSLGRRKLINLCLIIISVGMLASAFSRSQPQLLFLRFLTGLGIGGMLATLTTLVSEFSNDERRGLCIGVLQSGYPLGALLGGFISVSLIEQFGWRSLFLFGGSVSLLLLPIVIWKLPESLDFLLPRLDSKDKLRASKILEKLNLTMAENTEGAPQIEAGSNWRKCFNPESTKRNTLLIWASYFLLMYSFYFVVSWTPKLLVDSGLTTSQGISAGVYLQTGGLLGAIAIGLLGARIKVAALTAFFFLCGVVSMLCYGLGDLPLLALMALSGVMGFFLIGAMIGLYTIAPALYPFSVRVTGVGLAIGVGRLGAIAAPLVGGLVLNVGFSNGVVYALFAVPLVLAAASVYGIKLGKSLG